MHLSIADKAAIKRSYSIITKNESNVAECFYKNLFDMAPMIMPLFKSDREVLNLHFNELVKTAVHKIDHFEDLREDLLALGSRHKGYQVQLIHFDVVKSALLLTIQHELKGQCTPAVAKAWAHYIDDISAVMIEGFESQPEHSDQKV